MRRYFFLIIAGLIIFFLFQALNSVMGLWGRKKWARQIKDAVDQVKLILFEMIRKENSNSNIAGAVVNELFNTHTKATRSFFEKHKAQVLEALEKLIREHSFLKKLITESLLIRAQADHWATGKMPRDWENVFKNAYERGVFEKEIQPPEIHAYLRSVEAFRAKVA